MPYCSCNKRNDVETIRCSLNVGNCQNNFRYFTKANIFWTSGQFYRPSSLIGNLLRMFYIKTCSQWLTSDRVRPLKTKKVTFSNHIVVY